MGSLSHLAPRCVTLDTKANLSQPQFPGLQSGLTAPTQNPDRHVLKGAPCTRATGPASVPPWRCCNLAPWSQGWAAAGGSGRPEGRRCVLPIRVGLTAGPHWTCVPIVLMRGPCLWPAQNCGWAAPPPAGPPALSGSRRPELLWGRLGLSCPSAPLVPLPSAWTQGRAVSSPGRPPHSP